ncbi:MAG: hypothetical protein JW734_07015, partial [Candidatus Omnitrophica bacterium]|nr:hypothetical protein [Candidatus Omnitrophota bacterium]
AGRTVADLGSITTVDINGGSIDGTIIGANSAAAGTFSSLQTGDATNYVNHTTTGTSYAGNARPQRSFFIGVGGHWSSTTSGAGDWAVVEYAVNDINIIRKQFVDGSDTYAEVTFIMPGSWDTSVSDLTIVPYWTATSGAGDTVRWGFQTRSIGNDDPIDGAWGTMAYSEDAVTAADDLLIAPSATVSVSGAATGDLVQLRIMRDGNHANDDLNDDAYLIGVMVSYTANKEDDI